MYDVLTELEIWGCDVKGALERFLDDKEMYVKFLHDVAVDQTLDDLGNALATKKVEDAFECAHTLKGVHGNMGLTPLYKLDNEMVDPLRTGHIDGVEKTYEHMINGNKKLKVILSKIENENE